MKQGLFRSALCLAPVLLGFGILCTLGFWQISRMAWKQEILDALDSARAADPESLPILDFAMIEAVDSRIQRVRVEGSLRHDLSIALSPRTHQGKTGYHIFTPLQLPGAPPDSALLVNRGWSPFPHGGRAPAIPPPDPAEHVILTGILHHPETPNIFVPANRPGMEHWHRMDLPEMARARGIRYFVPMVLYLEAPQGEAHDYPIARDSRWKPRNAHASYAAFWFTLAGILVVIACLWRRKAVQNPKTSCML